MVRLNSAGALSSDVLNVARKGEMINLLDRLELMMVTVGTKAPIFSESLNPIPSWLDCLALTRWRNLGLQHHVLRKRRSEQLVLSV